MPDEAQTGPREAQQPGVQPRSCALVHFRGNDGSQVLDFFVALHQIFQPGIRIAAQVLVKERPNVVADQYEEARWHDPETNGYYQPIVTARNR